MKLKIYIIVFLFSMLFMESIYAEVSNALIVENKLMYKIDKINDKIDNIEIDTFKLRLEYQEIFDQLKNIEVNKQVAIYYKLIQNISQIELKSIGHLLRRMSLEQTFIKKIKTVIDSRLFTNEIQTNFVLEIEKNLLLTKEALLQASKNDNKYLVNNAKEKIKKDSLTKNQLNAVNYLYEYTYTIMSESTNLEINAIKTGSFTELNTFLKPLEKKYMVEYIPIINKDVSLVFKHKVEYEAGILAYMNMSKNLKSIYNTYMAQIESNEKFIRNYN